MTILNIKPSLIDVINSEIDLNFERNINSMTISGFAKSQARDQLLKSGLIEKVNVSDIEIPTLSVPDASEFSYKHPGVEIGAVATADSNNMDYSLIDLIQLPINNSNTHVFSMIREFQETKALNVSKANLVGKDGSLLQFVSAIINTYRLDKTQKKVIQNVWRKYYGDDPTLFIQHIINILTNPGIIGFQKLSRTRSIINDLGITEIIGNEFINDKQLLTWILKEDEIVIMPVSNRYLQKISRLIPSERTKSSTSVVKFDEIEAEVLNPKNKLFNAYYKPKSECPVIRMEIKESTITNTQLTKSLLVGIKKNMHAPIKEIIPQYLSDLEAKKRAYITIKLNLTKMGSDSRVKINDMESYRTN